MLCAANILFSQQQLRFEHITTAQGLSQNSVNCIFQDRNGFLWFGTKVGLNRYDGLSFTVFKSQPNDSTTLSDNHITAISEDREGYLWIGTTNGLNCFNPLTGKVKRYVLNDTNNDPIHENYINVIFVDTASAFTNYNKVKVIWIGFRSYGLTKLVIEGDYESSFHYRHSPDDKNSISDNSIQSIYCDAQGTLWIGTNANSLEQFVPSTNSFIHNYVDENRSAQCVVNALFTDSRKRTWAAVFNRGIFQIKFDSNAQEGNTKKAKFIPIQASTSENILSSRFPFSIDEDSFGNIWVGYLHYGLDKFELNANGLYTISHFSPDKNNNSSLSDFDIRTLLIDRSNILWAGGGYYGINKAPLQNQISLYVHNPSDVHSLPGKSIRGIFELHDGTILVGGYAELTSLERNDYYTTNENVKHNASGIQQSGAMNVYAIVSDPLYPDSILWLASEGDGLLRYSISNNRSTKFLPRANDPNALNSVYVFALYPEKDGNLWIGTWNGLQRLDVKNLQSPKFISYVHDADNPKSMSTGIVCCITKASSGILWVGSNDGGVNAIRPDKPNEFIHYVHNPKDSTSISNNDVRCIIEDKKGRMWFGTQGGGLNLLLPDGKSFKHFLETDGLPSNILYGILEDSSGNLWLSTNKGISRFTPSTNEFWNLTPKDGLQDFEFNTGSYYKCKHGEMFFGGINGMNSFFPEKLNRNTHIPPVHITSINIFGKEISSERLLASTPLRLAYNEDVLSFEFIALDYFSPHKNQYKYKMDGIDKEWIYAETRRFVTYSHIPPGEYRFQVKGSNNDGVWNEQSASITFIIYPPYWGTWWFQSFLVLVILLSIGGTIRYLEMKKVQEKINAMEKENALEKERLRISQDMHDDIGSRLTSIGLMSELSKRNIHNSEKLQHQLSDIAEAANDVVTSFDEIVWAVNPKYDTLENVVDYLSEYASNYTEKAELECALDIPSLLPRAKISAEIRHNIFMILKESLNNVVKYADASEVTLRFQLAQNIFSLEIQDDGKGFIPAEVKKFNNGLMNMSKRMEEVGGVCVIESEPDKGTYIKISVPL